MRHAVSIFILLAGLFLPSAFAAGADSLVSNGDFQKWTAGVPDDWEVTIGATNGANEPKSEVSRIKGPALMLRADASTRAFFSIAQEIPARADVNYQLEFESRTKDIKREGRQFNNCYVGVFGMDASGKVVARKIADVSDDSADWKQHRVEFAVPPNTASTKVTIFLSKSGILGVKNLSVTATGPSAPGTEAPQGQKALIANGDFSGWTDDRPDGWTVSIGAKNGADRPTSDIKRVGETGLSLQGKASTLAWYSLSQELPLQKGKTYTLEFEAQSQDVRRQGKQFDNCYVGLMSFDGNGKRAGMTIKDLSKVPKWRRQQVDFRVPANAAKTELLVFLSKTGTLMVNNISMKEATPKRPFRGSR